MQPKKQFNIYKIRAQLIPYILILPSLFYLFLFFGWPMLNAVGLSVRRESQILEVLAEPEPDSEITGRITIGSPITITGYQLDFRELQQGRSEDVYWYAISGTGEDGDIVTGWAVEESLDECCRPRSTRDGRILQTGLDAETLPIYENPSIDAAMVGEIDLTNSRIQNERLKDVIIWKTITGDDNTFTWFQISDDRLRTSTIGWVPAQYIRPFNDTIRIVPDDFSIDTRPRSVILNADGTPPLIYAEADSNAAPVGIVEPRLGVTILDAVMQPVQLDTNNRWRAAYWYYVAAPQYIYMDAVGLGITTVEGWLPQSAITPTDRVNVRVGGKVFDRHEAVLSFTIYAEPDANSAVLLELPSESQVSVWEGLPSETDADVFGWLRVSDNRGTTIGWIQDEYVVPWDYQTRFTAADFAISNPDSRVKSGSGEGEWTTAFFERMINDRRFMKALRTTLLLILLIVPVQFVLAIIMALVLQAQIKGSTIYLYIYAIPLGVSDLAAGLVWYSIFTQSGFINSLLNSLDLRDTPFTFIGVGRDEWMIFIIVLAEVWRATSIVMVIVVSGLQSIPTSYLEAGEVFGANLWQRLRYIVLPMLRPSLQVALILRTILAFQVFAVVIAITGGEVVTVLANETFRWYDPGRFNNKNMAAAYATFIMLISLGISFIYLRAVRSQEEAARP